MKCLTCGRDKKDHTPYLWLVHLNMHKAYKNAQTDIEKSVKQAKLRKRND